MIRVHTLGGLSVRDGEGRPIVGPATQPRRLAILALLARAGERGASRDKLLALLWPDADDERGPRTLAQALYALRKNLGAEDAISGAKELRFDPAIVSSDVSEFTSALSRGDDERAVALYHGPFLDCFFLPGADEFSRWIDGERAALASDYSRALESLARAARGAGDPRTSVAWWRRLAAHEPLNARVAVGLMDALVASGDRAAALQHARVYELLVEQDLDLPPDRAVLEYARRLRQIADEPRVPAVVTTAPAAPPAPVADDIVQESALVLPPEPAALGLGASVVASPRVATPEVTVRRGARAVRLPASVLAWASIGIGALAIAGAALFLARGRSATSVGSANGTGRVVAIGNITAFGTDSGPALLTAPVTDLLTTSLARVRAIRVVSHGRMLELMHSLGPATDTSAGGFVSAARQVGATEVIDGTLYARPGGRLRLDLRRVELASGAIGDVFTVEGADLFALVDSGTARLVASLGVAPPTGSVADVTTRSVTAYRMYEQGVRAYYRGDVRTALGFFDGALAEDSLFALAAYYAALADRAPRSHLDRMERAKQLAARASDRERLTILAGWAHSVSSPTLGAIAETLATRYPSELEGHLYSGIAHVIDGEFLTGLVRLQRVVTIDSLGLRGARPRCGGCDALEWIVAGYILADSGKSAEREARRWVRLQPRSESAAWALVSVLESQGSGAEADSIAQATAARDRSYATTVEFRTSHLIRAGEYASADRILLQQLGESEPGQQVNALWYLVISLREQGRLLEALSTARRARAPMSRVVDLADGAVPINVLEAQTLLEMGRPREAAVLFDSLAKQHSPNEAPSRRARSTAWMLTQSAGASFTAGDTAALGRLADSIRALGGQSGYGRDRRLHHHVRGLALAARGEDRAAIDELSAAIYSLTVGYTRTNFELARVYLRDRRPRDAVAVLQPALRGGLDASNLYLNRTELHELLAQAWDAAGVRDSAAAHYAVVARAWSAGDAPFKARGEKARRRGAELAQFIRSAARR